MKITRISINNFRLLENIELCLEDCATVIVGRNNSGKTSLTEFFRRLLDEKAPRFKLEDFSLGIHEKFRDAYQLYRSSADENIVRAALPVISSTMTIKYSESEALGPLSDFVIDLNEHCNIAQINVQYALAAGKISQFFADLNDDVVAFFKALKERIPLLFEIMTEAHDPNDPANIKLLEVANLRAVIQIGFINAQRTLDDASNKEKAILGKVFEKLFTAAASAATNTDERVIATSLVNGKIKSPT